ncbi:MAG: DUF3667 domain-containing protein [Flavobacteriales bacterium]|nr:DUF3667 domain-containing protein [Flavobacteriales bacterium]
MKCKNCNEELSGQEKFCANCGQKNIDKLTLKYILSQFVEDIFNVDSKVFKTLKFLTIKPGLLTKEYIEGKRVQYVPPIRLYIVLSVIFFFLISVFDSGDKVDETPSFTFNYPAEIAQSSDTVGVKDSAVTGTTFFIGGENVIVPATELKRMYYEGRLEEGLDSLTADMPGFAGYVSKKLAIAQVDDKGFMDILRDQFSLFLLLFLPFFALLYATVFSGSKKGFIGHLIFNLHLNSFVIFSLLIEMFVALLFRGNETLDTIWSLTIFLFGQYYIIKAVMVFIIANGL